MEEKKRSIPIRTSKLVDFICEKAPKNKRENFENLAEGIERTLHSEFFSLEEEIEDVYYPLNPNVEEEIGNEGDTRSDGSEKEFLDLIRKITDKANFNKLTQEEMDYALEKQSFIAVSVDHNFENISELLLFKRGEKAKSTKLPRFSFIPDFLVNSKYLPQIIKNPMQKERTLETYKKVLMLLRFTDEYNERKVGLEDDLVGGKFYVKVFKNVPKQDLEMILPNAESKMTFWDKLKIVVPLLIGLGAASSKLLNVFGGASLILIGSLMITLIGYAFKTYVSYKNKKLEYERTLSRGRYFKSLSDGLSSIEYLVNEAEEESTKESILGYYYLLEKGPLNSQELSKYINNFMKRKTDSKFEFDVEDATNRLKKLGIIEDEEDKFRAVPLEKAVEKVK